MTGKYCLQFETHFSSPPQNKVCVEGRLSQKSVTAATPSHAMVLASALRRGIHPPETFKMAGNASFIFSEKETLVLVVYSFITYSLNGNTLTIVATGNFKELCPQKV